MVCLGNICRSPLAEGILAKKLASEFFSVDSAGTGDYNIGKNPDLRSISVAKSKGLDISVQKARQFSMKDFADFDYIFAMDQSNYDTILKLAPNPTAQKKVKLILNELYVDENREVPDPYFGLENGFEIVYDMLDAACDNIAKNLQKKHL
jgi:protein-tyrosine phosphatase